MKKLFYIISISLVLVNGVVAQWVPQNSGTPKSLHSVYFPDANTGYAVGDSGTILKTIDGGTIWNIQVSTTTQSLNSVFFIDANTGYAVGDSGTILKTVNGGITWTAQASGTTWSLLSVGFFNADTGYAIGYGILLKTTNGGGNWTAKPTSATGGTPIGGGAGYFIDANIGYQVRYESVFGTHGVISKTVDGGDHWSDYWVSTPLFGVYFPVDTIGYVVGGYPSISGIILKTTNGGGTWTEQSLPIDNTLQSVYFTDANTGYAVGDSGTILKTTNGGILWTSQTSGTFNRLLSVYFTDTNTGYIVGEDGIILKTTNGGITGVNNQPSTSNSLKIYPNPSSDKITIETDAKGQLSILNLNDKELITRQITEPKTILDISGLPNGVYFIRVRDERTVQVGKFIKQ